MPTCCLTSIIEHSSALAPVCLLMNIFHGSFFHVTSHHVLRNECLRCEFPLDMWSKCQTQRMQLCLFAKEAFHCCCMLPQHFDTLPTSSSFQFAVSSLVREVFACTEGHNFNSCGWQHWKYLSLYKAAAMTLVWAATFLLKCKQMCRVK